MKSVSLLILPFIFSFTGCAAIQAQAPVSQPDAANSTPAAPDPVSTSTPSDSTSGSSAIQKDYASTTPLPSTGKVTIRDQMRNLDTSRLIADCPTDSAPYAFAESTNYQVQICSQEFDPWLPKYYIGHAKDQSGDLRITSGNPEQARQLIFKHDDYTYVIYRDGARAERQNAYLQIFTPEGNYAEALLYLYEMGAAPTS